MRSTPSSDLARWAPLPGIVPLLEWRQRSLPYVVVLTDRTGADILAAGGRGPAYRDRTEGREEPIRKVAPGGWSQPRFQQRAENTWAEKRG